MMIINKLNNLLNNTSHHDINHVIGKYIKKNLDKIGYMSIKDLADATYVSQAKISKFIKTLGYDNFIAFKDDCRHMTQVKELVIEDQKENLNLDYKKHVSTSLETIKTNLLNVDEKMIEKLVYQLHLADEIYLYGNAYSNMLCQYVQYESDFIGKKVIVVDELVNRDYVMKKNSMIIMISVDGHSIKNEKREVRKLLKLPAKKWLITTNHDHIEELDLFDHVLLVPSEHTESKDRRILIRYLLDAIIGRFQYLYKD